MFKGKRIKNLKEKVEAGKFYTLEEACKLTTELASAKFDETVEVTVALGVDPRKADQNVRGSISLPHGLGKEVRVAVFAKAEKAEEAKNAGADVVGSDDLVEQIKGGFLEFDKVVATPDMMIQVGKIGKILGPKGLMPSPKEGTVTFDVAKAIDNIKKGQVEYKTEKAGIVHAGVAKASFSEEAIKQNVQAFIDEIIRVKPAVVKVNYVKSIYLSTTMGPSVKLVSVN